MNAPAANLTAYRVIDTRTDVEGPHGYRYVNDASRPFAVLANVGRREICVTRRSSAKSAADAIRNLTK